MTQGAPDAVQVADRFHLIHNLSEVLEQVMRSQMSEVRRMVAVDCPALDAELEADRGAVAAVADIESAALAPLESHYQQRQKLHRVIWQLHEQGWSSAAIAVHVGVSIRTVQRDLNKPKFVDAQRRADYGKSLVAPYRAYILQRYTPGGRRPHGLLEALRKQGYRGSDRTLRRYLNQLSHPEPIKDRQEAEEMLPLPPMPPVIMQPVDSQRPLSAKQVVWLVLRTSTRYTAEEERILTVLQSKTSPVAPAIELAQGFARLIRQRQPEQFEAWLEQVSESKIAAFVNFAKGLKEDFDAVKAAMTLSTSNGAVEGQINRLKVLKRQMYGRAGIKLLRQRFLLAS